mmetsp:Transcript_52485/g.122460  ORF Transcript_52485/g.122460 Transcript_52485/m.122460 type:complete len:171 (+) Transcript_52485:48-560(+)
MYAFDVLPPPQRTLDSHVVGSRRPCQRLGDGHPRKTALMEKKRLKLFLTQNRCGDVSEPQASSGCLGMSEVLYPIHLAARCGDPDLVRALLKARADPAQRTSRGRLAWQVAEEADKRGSHAAVLAYIKEVRVCSVREALSCCAQEPRLDGQIVEMLKTQDRYSGGELYAI